jgi:hypothetical protein
MVEGLHRLAYSLTLDPAEEIRGALESAAQKSWQELRSLDKILEERADGIEAEVQDAPVYVRDNGASYRADDVELPENYRHAAYDSPDAEVSYSFNPDVAWDEARQLYDAQLDGQAQASILQSKFVPNHKSAEEAERVKNYSISIGSLSFVLYDIKSASL